MSTLTYLTSLVQQAISRLNNYEANAKKVDELPHQTTLEPTSKIPVSRDGNSEHVTVQQIISSIQNSNYNQLLSVGNITVDGTDIIVDSGVSGQINGSLYGTSTEITIPIALCDSGFNRKDILVLTTSNTIIAISGEETDGAIVLAPPTPIDTIYITEFDVNDTSIGAPIDPIIGTSFKKKSESLGYGDPSLTGSNAVIQLRPEGNSRYALGNAGLISIDGFGLSLITGNPSAEVPYDGKDLFIENTGTTPFTLKHDGSGSANIKFFFIDETDLVIPPGGKVWLKYGNPYCEVIFQSFDEKGYKIIAQNLTDSAAVTGTTAITTVETFTIPANTFKVGDTIILVARILKTGTNAVVSHRHNLGNNTFPQINIVYSSSLPTNLYHQIQRIIIVKSPTITEELIATASASTSNGSYLSNHRANIDWTIPQDLSIGLNNNSASDSSIVSSWQLIRLRP